MLNAISYTRANRFNHCKAAYNNAYNLKITEVATMPLLGGGLFHDLAEKYGKHLAKTQEATDIGHIETLLDKAKIEVDYETYEGIAELFREWAEGYIYDPALGSDFELELAFTEGWKQVEWYADDVFLRAKLDRVDLNASPIEIRDYKTARALPHKDLLQLKIYAFSMNLVMGGNREYRVVEEYVRLGLERATTLTYDDYKGVGDYLLGLAKTIEKTETWPEEVSSHCNFCGFKSTCGKYSADVSDTILDINNAEDAAALAEKLYTLKTGFIKNGEEILKVYVTENGAVVFGDQAYAASTKSALSFPELQKAVKALIDEGATNAQVWDALGLTKTNLTALARKIGHKGKAATDFVEAFTSEYAELSTWGEFRFKKATKEQMEAAVEEVPAAAQANRNGDKAPVL